ncbi:MAG: DUF58 domain-containing protein [Gammaproteobacteria bacterium]|nr:DUF58 domain-containing protein [Gammaproteobacteria bacterium]
MSLKPSLDDLLELRHRANALGISARHRVNSRFDGLYASAFHGQGMAFEEVREYRLGDDIRRMDWRVTARTGTPHLKLFREERERVVLLAVDVGPHMYFGTRGTFKSVQAAHAAALLGWGANRHGDRVGGLMFSDTGLHYFPPLRGPRGLWRLLRGLAEMEPPESVGAAEQGLVEPLRHLARTAPTGALIFVIGDFNLPPEQLDRALRELSQRHQVVLLPVDDPAERDMPSAGLLQLGLAPSLLVFSGSRQAAADYRQAWDERRESLKAISRRARVELMPVRTDEEIHLALADRLVRLDRAYQHRV